MDYLELYQPNNVELKSMPEKISHRDILFACSQRYGHRSKAIASKSRSTCAGWGISRGGQERPLNASKLIFSC